MDCAAFQSSATAHEWLAFSPYPSDSYRIRNSPKELGKKRVNTSQVSVSLTFKQSSSVSWPPNCSGNCRKKELSSSYSGTLPKVGGLGRFSLFKRTFRRIPFIMVLSAFCSIQPGFLLGTSPF